MASVSPAADKIHSAVIRQDAAAVRHLLEQDPKVVNAPAKQGVTPLHIAAGLELPAIATILIEAGADVDAITQRGSTPLHFAAKRNSHRTAVVLLENGAQISARMDSGITPLQLAVRRNAKDVIRVLLARLSKKRAAVCSDPSFREAYLVFESKYYEKALAMFSRLLREYPDSIDVNEGYGLAAFAVKKYPHAAAAFERILMINPDHIRARFDLARSYFVQKRFEIAQQHFAGVLKRTSDSRVRAAVQSYLDNMGAIATPLRFNAMISLGAMYDSNVNVGPDADTISIAPISFAGWTIDELEVEEGSQSTATWGGVASAAASCVYDVGRRDGWVLSAVGSYYRTVLQDASDYEALYIGAGVSARYAGQDYAVDIPVKLRHIQRGGNALVNLYSAAPSCVYAFGERHDWQLIGALTVESRDYTDLDERDGYFVSSGCGIRRLFGGRRHSLTFGAARLQEDTESDVYSNDGFEVNGACNFKLPWRASAYVRARYKSLDYKEAASLEPEPRSDSQQQYSVGVVKAISRRLNVELSGQYTDNNSTFGLYNYTRWVTTLSTSYTF